MSVRLGIALAAALILAGCASNSPTNTQGNQQLSGVLHSVHGAQGGPVTGYVLTQESGGRASGTSISLDVAAVSADDLKSADGKNVIITGMSKPDSQPPQFVAQSILIVNK